MVAIYTRSLKRPARAFFLFGPRGTGKSTWTKAVFKDALRIDLLQAATSLEYQKNPSLLQAEVKARPKNDWIVIDEIQKVPQLLDEIHSLMENAGYRHFVLTGSSARKLKRGASNLLAGRAGIRNLFPLNSYETNFSISPNQVTLFGLLPASVNAANEREREEYLQSYVTTYLQEEIKAESLVRNLGSFARFLEVAALSAGQKVNVSGLARDTGIGRETARGYFSVMEDTLIGSWLPGYRPRAKVKEVVLPKFYWFDPGVLNAAAGGFRQPLPRDWNGVLFEHWILHEIRSYMHYTETKGSLGYWGTPSENEIDFLWWYGDRIVAIEVKASRNFDSRFLKGFHSFEENKKLESTFLVYLGDKELKVDGTWVLPVDSFLRRLMAGDVIG